MFDKVPCIFCSLPDYRIIDASSFGVVIRDGFPISPGHTLVISKRHVASFFHLTADEREDLLMLADRAKAGLDAEFKPDGYNIGINDGAAAGQTVMHLHIHMIPRFIDDRPNPISSRVSWASALLTLRTLAAGSAIDAFMICCAQSFLG